MRWKTGPDFIELCKIIIRCYYECKLKEFFNRNIMIVELPREDVVALYKESDVFLFPSNVECSPIVLFEAMAAGPKRIGSK